MQRILTPERRNRLGFAFLCGFLATLTVHAYAFVSHINIHDQVRNVFAIPATITLGRWLLGSALDIGTRLSMPWFNGLMLALALGLTSAVLTELFGLTRRLSILLVALVLCTFPTLAESILYIHVVDAYGYAILLAALAALLTDRYRWGFLPGAVCLTLSLGIYQAYLPLMIGWLTIRGLQRLLREEDMPPRALLWLGVRYAAALMLGAALYLLINRVVITSAGVTLDSYMGVSTMGQVKLQNIGHLLKTAYLNFFRHYLTDAATTYGVLLAVFNGIVLVFDVAALGWLIFRRRRGWLTTLVAVGALCMLPLLFDTIYLLNSDGVHQLMIYSIACPYWLAIVLMNLLGELPRPRLAIRKALTGGMVAVLLAVCFSYTVYANQLYYLLNLNFEATSQYASRVLYRLESREDYTADTPVLFVGSAGNSAYGSIPFYQLSFARLAYVSPFFVLQSDSHTRGFFRSYLGVDFPLADAETNAAILSSDEVKAMPEYPAQDCMRMIDGVLVIKLGPTR